MFPSLFPINPYQLYAPFFKFSQQMMQTQLNMLEQIAGNTAAFPLKLDIPLEGFVVKIEVHSLSDSAQDMRTIDGEILERERNK